MIAPILIVAGLLCGVAAGFLIAAPVGLAALCVALLFTGWASLPRPKE